MLTWQISRLFKVHLEQARLVKNANKEVLFIFPSSGALIRQEKMGAVPLAIEATKKRAARVRILVPYNKEVEDRIKLLKGRRPTNSANIEIRYTEQTSGTMATILVVDRRVSLVMELRDDSTKTFDEAIGLSSLYNIDLIVIGTRGRSGFKRASYVVSYAHCPVSVVK